MKYRTFGKLGWQISEISFGAGRRWCVARAGRLRVGCHAPPRPGSRRQSHRYCCAIKFALAHPAMSTVIPGMRTLSQVEANTAVSDLPDLPASFSRSSVPTFGCAATGTQANDITCWQPVRSIRWVVFARTCSKFVLPIPCSILPMGGFCPNLLETCSAKSPFDPSNGWFLPELARNSFCQVLARSFRWVVFARTCSKFVLPSPVWPFDLVSSQPRIRVLAEPMVHAVRECFSAASSFVFPEITAAIEREMILWSGKEHGAGVAHKPLSRGG